jgi:hypothetical protein
MKTMLVVWPRADREPRFNVSGLVRFTVICLCLLFAVAALAQQQAIAGIVESKSPTLTTFDAPGAGSGPPVREPSLRELIRRGLLRETTQTRATCLTAMCAPPMAQSPALMLRGQVPALVRELTPWASTRGGHHGNRP